MKLSQAARIELVRLYMAGESSVALANAFGVSKTFIFYEAKKRGLKKGRMFSRDERWRRRLIDSGKITGALP
jgi:hypothetical protein